MNDHPLVQALHAAISRRRWDEVEAAANRIRDDRGIGWPEENGSRHVENWKPRWRCAVRTQSTPWGEVQDCNWPVCGCDPYADKVIDALHESGLLQDATSPLSRPHGGIEDCNCVGAVIGQHDRSCRLSSHQHSGEK